MIRLHRLVILLIIGCLSASIAHAESGGDPSIESFVDEVLLRLGFDPSHKGHLHEGKILTRGLPDLENQPNELAVGAVLMLVRRPLEVVAEALVDDVIFRANTEILDYRTIGVGSETPEQIEAVFDAIRFTADEGAEANRLLGAKPGTEFNLSESEFARLAAIQSKEEARRGQASNVMSDILADRYRAYLENGLDSLEPYARSGGKKAYPRKELSGAIGSLELVERYFSAFYRSLFEYPGGPRTGMVHRFFWVKREADDRPAYVLAHRTEHAHGEFVVAGELQFYVGHSYNSMLSVIACVPTQEGTLVLSMSRLFTDQVTGLGSGLKKRVGRGQVVEAVADLFAKLRDELER